MQISCNLKKKSKTFTEMLYRHAVRAYIHTLHVQYSNLPKNPSLPCRHAQGSFLFLIIWCFLTIILLLHLLSLPHLKEKFRTQIQTGHQTVVSL